MLGWKTGVNIRHIGASPYLGLNAQDVAFNHLLLIQRLFVEELDAKSPVVNL